MGTKTAQGATDAQERGGQEDGGTMCTPVVETTRGGKGGESESGNGSGSERGKKGKGKKRGREETEMDPDEDLARRLHAEMNHPSRDRARRSHGMLPGEAPEGRRSHGVLSGEAPKSMLP